MTRWICSFEGWLREADWRRDGVRWGGFFLYGGWLGEDRAQAVSCGRLISAFCVTVDAETRPASAVEGYDMSDRVGFFKHLRRLASKASVAGGVEDPDAMSRWPYLVVLLSEPTYPDGEPRQLASMTIFVDGGSWKACLSDRDTDQALFASSETLAGLLDAMEGRLAGPDPDWRRKGAKPSSPRPKKR